MILNALENEVQKNKMIIKSAKARTERSLTIINSIQIVKNIKHD